MERQPRQRPAVGRDRALARDGIECPEQRQRFREGGLRRRIEEAKQIRRRNAPAREFQRESGEVRFEDFGPVERFQRVRLPGVPEAVADARLGAAGATAALVGGGARDAAGFERGEPGRGVVGRRPPVAGIDHDADAEDRERGLRDRRRQHHFPPPGGSRRHRTVLLGDGELAVERIDVDIRRDAPGEPFRDAADLPLAGKEHEDRAGLLRQRVEHRARDLVFERHGRIARHVARLDRKRPAFGADDRRVVEEPGDARPVDGGRHDADAEIVAEGAGVEREGKAEIGVEVALVEFVEEDGGDAGKAGVVLDHPREHALGDHLDPRPCRDLRVEADAVADRAADLLAERRRHPPCRAARGEPPRLEQDDPAVAAKRSVEERERDARRLAGAGRGDDHRRRAGRERGENRRQRVVDRKGVGQDFAPARGTP